MAKTLKQQIRKTIKQHYGENLWTFRADANYGEATESFVNALSRVIKGKIEYKSDWQCDLAKYEKPSSLDISLGGRLKDVRLQKNMTVQEVAKGIRVHTDYLVDLEQGRVGGQLSVLVDALESMSATHKDKAYVAETFRKDIPVKDLIRDVIQLFYGRNLWTFSPQFEYEESIAPFVQALVDLDQNWHRKISPMPVMPSLGEMIEIEERRRKIASNAHKTAAMTHAHSIQT